MNLRVITLLCLLFPLIVFGQKKEKPRMLIYGDNYVARKIADQAILSNIPVLVVLSGKDEMSDLEKELQQNSKIDNNPLNENKPIDELGSLEAGARVIQNHMQLKSNLLTLFENTQVNKITKGKRNWEVVLSNKQKFSVISVLDASSDAALTKLSNIKFDSPEIKEYTAAKDMKLAESRTTLASMEMDGQMSVVFLKDILQFEKDNFFDLGSARSVVFNEMDTLNQSFELCQALAATVGYLAFFKTDSKKIDIRKLQAELLSLFSDIIPYQDILLDINEEVVTEGGVILPEKTADSVKTTANVIANTKPFKANPHYKAIQKCYLTGFFLGKSDGNRYIFDKDSPVRFAEIKDVLNDIYTRSQLWFLDNYRDEELTWKDLVSLIKFISFKGDEVEKYIAKEWSNKLKFEGEYRPENKVTREQFAVVTDLFSTAFSKAINLDGSFVK